MTRYAVPLALLVLLASGRAAADDRAPGGPPGTTETGDAAENSGDGYCDYVEGVAAAQSAAMLGPEVFSQFGLIEQSAGAINPDQGGLRLIAGVRVRFDQIYTGLATRDRAHADCRRHRALEQVRGETAYRALDARAKVLDAALAETTKILAQTQADLEARRIATQDATATRLRVEELRELATQTHRDMSLLPQPTTELSGALDAFQRADDELESYEGKIRRAAAFDVSVRLGFDEFLNRGPNQNPSPYFAVVAVGVNLGALFQGSGNARAADGRRRLVRSGRDPFVGDASADKLRATVDEETKRAEQTAALEADLQHQLDSLRHLEGDDSKRYRQTVWFDYIKVKAEHAYLATHLAALHQVLGGVGP